MAGHSEPTSWADDLNQYRSQRGCLSYSSISRGDDVPIRFARTSLVPFADTKHPLYSYQEPFRSSSSDHVTSQRYQRHGWGDLSLLSHISKTSSTTEATTSRASRSKIDMFSVLQLRNPHGEPDAWYGNLAIDPSAGKKSVAPPKDSKGRKNLFQVLNQRDPAPPSSDGWLGNQLIDPGKGKQWCAGPELRLGRPNLFPLMQQTVLHEHQSGKRSDQSKAYADSWIGHHLISPTAGKAEVQCDVITNGHLLGALMAPHVEDTDFGKIGRRPIGREMSNGHSLHDTVDRLHDIQQGDPAGQDWRARVKSRRHFDCTPRARPVAADIVYRRVQPPAWSANSVAKWTEDGPVEGRAHVPILHSPDPDGGANIPLWTKMGPKPASPRSGKRLFRRN